jgi:23S rRNA G2445 N2-methylase RlmL
MPFGVLNRIIKASSNKNDIVLDPFNGSGTTVVAAALLDRQYVGIDQADEYVAHARKRLAHALEHKENGREAAPILLDAKRASRVQTQTDAFGRPRVARRSRAKSA